MDFKLICAYFKTTGPPICSRYLQAGRPFVFTFLKVTDDGFISFVSVSEMGMSAAESACFLPEVLPLMPLDNLHCRMSGLCTVGFFLVFGERLESCTRMIVCFSTWFWDHHWLYCIGMSKLLCF